MARTPKGGDTDQIKAVAAGECAIALSNTYYYARLLRSTEPADKRDRRRRPASCSPTRRRYGTHVNISGAGVLKNAPHKENARKFLEYLASNDAQRYFADGNNEWPVVASAKVVESRARRDGHVQDRSAADRDATARTRPKRRRSPTVSAGSSRGERARLVRPHAVRVPACPARLPADRAPARRSAPGPTATIASDGSAASASRSSFANRYVCVASVSKLNGRSTSVAGSSFITSTNTSSSAAAPLRASSGTCTRRSVPPRAGAEAARRGVHRRRDAREARLDAVPRHGEVAHEIRVDQRDDRAGQQQPGAAAGQRAPPRRRARCRARRAAAARRPRAPCPAPRTPG